MGSLFHGRCWSMGLCFVCYLMCPVGKGEGFFFQKLSTFSLEIWENSFNAQFVWTAEKSAASPSSALRCKKQKVKQNLSCVSCLSLLVRLLSELQRGEKKNQTLIWCFDRAAGSAVFSPVSRYNRGWAGAGKSPRQHLPSGQRSPQPGSQAPSSDTAGDGRAATQPAGSAGPGRVRALPGPDRTAPRRPDVPCW